MNQAERLEQARLQGGPSYNDKVVFLETVGQQMELPTVSNNPQIQALYVACRMDGQSHKMAEMLATRQSPVVRSDATFLRGHCNGSQFEDSPWIGDEYAREANQAGVDVKGKVYLGSLARYPGDPEAWVSDRGDVRRVLESRGWACEGAVKTKAAEPLHPPQRVAVAEDLVQDEVERMLDQIPVEDRPSVEIEELREKAIDKLSPPWSD